MFKVLETRPRGQWADQPNATEITLAAVTVTAEPPHMMSQSGKRIS